MQMTNRLRMWIRKPIFWILLGALVLRLAVAFYLGNTVSGLSGAYDEISYSLLGQRFADGYGLTFPKDWYPWIKAGEPQSYYSATMSLFLGVIYMTFGYYPLVARLVMALLSTLVVYMTYRLTRKIMNERVALIAALIAAGYAYLVFYGVTLVTETPFILALLIAFFFAYDVVESPTKWKWVAMGAALSVAVLLRMAVVFFLPFLFGWIMLRQPKKRVYVLIPISLIILSVLPFTIHNYNLWGQFLLLESQFGHVFWNGNHPGQKGSFSSYNVFPIPEDVLATRNDAEITNRLLRLGVQNVLDDPRHFFVLTLSRLQEFFKFWPTSDSTTLANLLRVVSFGIMWPFAVAGLWLQRKSLSLFFPLILFMIIHTGIYSISWTMIRYRIPLDAVLIPFAAYAIHSILSRWEWFRNRMPFLFNHAYTG